MFLISKLFMWCCACLMVGVYLAESRTVRFSEDGSALRRVASLCKKAVDFIFSRYHYPRVGSVDGPAKELNTMLITTTTHSAIAADIMAAMMMMSMRKPGGGSTLKRFRF